MKNGIIKDNGIEDNSKFTRGKEESASEANKKCTTLKRLIVPFYKSRFNAWTI